MSNLKTIALMAAAALPLAACTAERDSGGRAGAPAAVAVGDPVNCVQTSLIRDTRVHDDSTIDFHMRNNTIFRNTLPNRCSGLGFERRFAYRTTIGRLCNVDTITVLRSGGINGPSCGLGQFVPVELTDD